LSNSVRDPVPVVRLATPDDWGAIASLENSRLSIYRGSDDLAAIVDDTDGQWLVAVIDEVIVGTAKMSTDRTPRPTVLCVVVHPDARGLGIGAALVSEIRRIARAGGHSRVDALALPGDRETKNLYERAGLTARLIIASGEA
jgi:GNAT superfamily N-acetyltransferase